MHAFELVSRIDQVDINMQREQGPWDWLIPFIPPVLRVNRETRDALQARLQELSVRGILLQLAAGIKQHWPLLLRVGLPAVLWIAGLLWVDRRAHEFSNAYVIISGFALLGVHLLSGDATKSETGLSAYSIFNPGAQRMLGSLSAEQFEVGAPLPIEKGCEC